MRPGAFVLANEMGSTSSCCAPSCARTTSARAHARLTLKPARRGKCRCRLAVVNCASSLAEYFTHRFAVLYAPLRAPVTWRRGDPRFCNFLLESKLSAVRTPARSRCKTYAAWFSFAVARGATGCHKPSVTVIWCQLPEREDLRATRMERFNFFISVILTGGRQTVALRAKK